MLDHSAITDDDRETAINARRYLERSWDPYEAGKLFFYMLVKDGQIEDAVKEEPGAEGNIS